MTSENDLIAEYRKREAVYDALVDACKKSIANLQALNEAKEEQINLLRAQIKAIDSLTETCNHVFYPTTVYKCRTCKKIEERHP